jgi:hypothetical protein
LAFGPPPKRINAPDSLIAKRLGIRPKSPIQPDRKTL